MAIQLDDCIDCSSYFIHNMTSFFCLTTAKATLKMEWSITSFAGEFAVWG